MTIEKSDFESVTEQDLQDLVDAQVPEGLRLDFKLTQYGKTDSDKRELLKDVSALANSHGGHLILGVEETDGTATKIVGIEGLNTDAEILRMENITRSGLEPPVPGIRLRAIPLASGKHVLLMRIPRSWHPPHRVVAQRSNRFYVRHSAGVHEPSIEELRTLFTQSASALVQARRFRDDRLQAIREERLLVGDGRLILHVVPVAAFSGMVHLDVEQVYERHMAFRPIDVSGGTTPRYNYNGFINEDAGSPNLGYTQVFRNGALEATQARIVDTQERGRRIDGQSLENGVIRVLSQYIGGLKNVSVPPPLILMITLEDVQDAIYAVNNISLRHKPPLLPKYDPLTLPEGVLEDYGTDVDHHRAIRPAFDALWNAVGYPRSQFYNEEGRWVGPH